MKTLTMTAVVALFTAAVPVHAQEIVVYGGTEFEILLEPDGAGSDDDITLDAYVEAELRGFYAGLWAEVANDSVANEINLYFGYRATTESGLSYDAGYTRYYYPNDGGDCCGELTLSLGQTIGDKANITFDGYYDPDIDIGSAYLGADYYLTDKLNVSVYYGVYQVEEAANETEWEIGATYYVTDEIGIDGRYYDGSEYVDPYVGLSVTFDTTIFGG